MAMVWLGERTGLEWLRYADPVAALGVAAVIIWVAARLGRRTVDALLDAAPAGLQERVARAVEELEGVLSHRTCARAPRGQSAFRGRHHQRSARGELRAGARDQRRRGAARRRDHAGRRDGAHGAARAGRRAPLRRDPRRGAAPGSGDARSFGPSARRTPLYRDASGGGRAPEPARGASPGDRPGRRDSPDAFLGANGRSQWNRGEYSHRAAGHAYRHGGSFRGRFARAGAARWKRSSTDCGPNFPR